MPLWLVLASLSLASAPAPAAPFEELVQPAGVGGCVSEGGAGGCAPGKALTGAMDTAVSPDGKSVYAASHGSRGVAILRRDLVTGGLTQPPDRAGCVTDDGTGGRCVTGRALDGAEVVSVSPDGKNVYVAAIAADAVAVFQRNQETGALTQLDGTDGCVSEDGTGGLCTDGKALEGAASVTVSPDGENVYVTGYDSDSVAIFRRDQARRGALTQLDGTDGCVSEDGTGGLCADGKALDGATSVAVSPDGQAAYVASWHSDAVAILHRQPSGTLVQPQDTTGCISETSTGGTCTRGRALGEPSWLAVSPNGRNAYVSARVSDAVAVFARNDKTGLLSQLPGRAGCVSRSGTGGACGQANALAGPYEVTVSPDGRSAYAAANGASAVIALSRNEGTGALSQLAGAAGCTSQFDTAGLCARGRALDGASSVVVSPNGKSAYAASTSSNAVAVFERGRTPELRPQPGLPSPTIGAGARPSEHRAAVKTVLEIRIVSRVVRLTRRGVARVKVACVTESHNRCKGPLTLKAANRALRAKGSGRKRGRLVTLGRGRFSIKGGHTAAVSVKLSRSKRRAVIRRKVVRVHASARARNQAGLSAKATRTIKLKASKTARAPR